MNKNDLRYIKTELAIRESFIKCIDDVGFENTTVSLICKNALISRNTFYVHYDDKYALYKKIYNEFELEISTSIDEILLDDVKNLRLNHSVRWMIDFISKHKIIIKTLINSSKNDFTTLIEQFFVDKPMSILIDDYYNKLDSLDVQLTKAYMLQATIGFIEVWVNSTDSLSKNELYQLMKQLCSPSTTSFYNKLQL